MNIAKKVWQVLENLKIFDRFIRIRWGLMLWGGLGLLAVYIIITYLMASGVLLVETKIVDKQTRDKEIKVGKEKAEKYDDISKENKSLKNWKETKAIEYYKIDLVFRLYEYYKNMGLLQRYYWISRKLFEEVYDSAIRSKDYALILTDSILKYFRQKKVPLKQ